MPASWSMPRTPPALKAVVTARGAEALDLALQYKPVAMSLDIFLPDMLGWNVLSQFKRTLETRHIPVQILSMDEDRQQGLARGAFSYLNKPTTSEGPERGAGAHQRLCAAAQEAAADRRGQRGRAVRRHRAAVASRHRDRHRRLRPRRPRQAARGALRLHGARPAPARPVGLRGAGGDTARRRPGRPAGGGVHRPRPVARGGRQAAHHGALDRGQGRGLAGAAVRRDRALPAPGRRRPARATRSACWSACTAPTRCWPAAPCWWSTTTRATSSPCRARSSGAACAC